MKVTLVFGVGYSLLAILFGVILGGAGHGIGIQYLFYLGFPASLIHYTVPDTLLMAIAGGLQWIAIGGAFDFYRKRKSKRVAHEATVANNVVVLGLSILVLASSGCSSMIINSGFDEEKFFDQKPNPAKVHKRFGKPINTEYFAEPIYIKMTNDFGLYHGFEVGQGWAETRQDFVYRGYIADPHVTYSYDLSVAMTFGLGELFCFPASIVQVLKHSRDKHAFSVWFDGYGRFSAVRRVNPVAD
jgi:hypothetical protein